jgi:uncharacterized protein YecE (DUF72 family)
LAIVRGYSGIIFASMDSTDLIRIGTCSWKYDSWNGLVYSGGPGSTCLEQYSRHYRTVEIDQWFWSLFKSDMPVLPKSEVVREYAAAVPPGFLFSIKVPNSITLTHHYGKGKGTGLVPNPHFLSNELMERFLQAIAPLGEHIGPLMFQFEYLNKIKMASLHHFLELFEVFRHKLPEGYTYCIEIRNPNWLRDAYFYYLAEHGLGHVFLQGYYMPSIFEVYWKFKENLAKPVVIRLHGPGREDIEKLTGNVWNRIVEPKDNELLKLSRMVSDLEDGRHQVFINVNNHYEGSAPLTINRIKERLAG